MENNINDNTNNTQQLTSINTGTTNAFNNGYAGCGGCCCCRGHEYRCSRCGQLLYGYNYPYVYVGTNGSVQAPCTAQQQAQINS